jgi:hypothetical protein
VDAAEAVGAGLVARVLIEVIIDEIRRGRR